MRFRKWALPILALTIGLLFLTGGTGLHTALRPGGLHADSAASADDGQGFTLSIASALSADDNDEEDEDEEQDEDDDGLEFKGVIASLSGDRLVLTDGTTFVINAETELESGLAVGSDVEVEAIMMALEIAPADGTKALEFEGVVASIIVVLDDGTRFVVNGATRFESGVKIGTGVEIDAVLLAVEIEANDEADGDDSDDDEADDVDAADDADGEEYEEGDKHEQGEGQDREAGPKGPTFSGVVTSLSDTRLGLNKRLTFVIDQDTQLKGEAKVGAEVEVEIEIVRGLLLARTVEVKAAAKQDDKKAPEDSDEIDLHELQAEVDNPLFPLPPLSLLVYEGEEEDGGEAIETRVEARVLPDTEEIAGVEVRVVLIEEYEDGGLIERTLDLYAQDKDGTVMYMGEFVDEIEDGKVVGHGGQWLAGEGKNLAGVFMPAAPKVGDIFEQERAPGIAEDRSEVIATGVRLQVPAGAFSGCIKTRDFDPIGGHTEFKLYCPGVGLVREEADGAFLDLVSVGKFDPDELDEDVIDAIGGQGSNGEGEEGEADELEITGIVESLSDASLVLKDGTTFIINGDTQFEVKVRAGMRVEVVAIRSDGKLIALEIDRD